MSVVYTSMQPQIDPRIEFWGDPSSWPRETVQHSFLGNVVHDLGRHVFHNDWTEQEPQTAAIYPIRPVLDTATSAADISLAVKLLVDHHNGFSERFRKARADGQPAPLPTHDEWPIAVGLTRVLSDASTAALQRYIGVMKMLVAVFELGIVQAAFRNHDAGFPQPLAPSDWINEIYPHWFATCQIDPENPFCGVPVRDGGCWIYVERDSYVAWRDASFRATSDTIYASYEPAPEPPTETTATPSEAEQPPKHKAGAKPKYDWPSFDAEVMRVVRAEGEPHSGRAFAERMLQWCEDTWGKQPSESRAREQIRKILAANGPN